MIIGSHYFGVEFFESDGPKEALERLLNETEVSYFGYITAKFCLLKAPDKFKVRLTALNARVRSKLVLDVDSIGTKAENYLLACDYLSSPDVTAEEKRTMVESFCGGAHSNAAAFEAGKYLGFVDWFGVRIAHVLARRELRPVYSW